MDFVFQGFQSNLPFWLYLLLIFGTTTLAWWSYKDAKSIRPLFRYGLVVVRSLVFFILLALLVNPFYKAERTALEKSEIMVLWDNSASTSIQKGAYKGKQSYQKVIRDLRLNDSSAVTYRTYSVGATVNPGSLDSLALNESQTNLYHAIETIKSREKDIKGVILITDGIFNQGRNPAFEAGNIAVPVMTVALGDTVEQKDLIVEEVTTNSTGYVHTLHPVEVRVSTNGFAGRNVRVQLKKGAEVLHQQMISPENDRSVHTLNFEMELNEEGLRQFEVTIPAAESEWTATNNSHPFAVDVLNEKQRILSLAFEIHPDVRFIRSELLQDENTRLISRTWLGSNRFIEGALELSADTLDLVILHGYPGSGLPGNLEATVKELIAQTPWVVMVTPLANINALERVSDTSLPVSYPGTGNRQQVKILPNVEPTAHPIMEIPDVSYDLLPPLTTPLRNGSVSAGTNVLFVSSHRGTETQQPFIAVEEIGNMRRTQINGYGWYRYAQSTNAQVQNFGRQLFSNIISWTATKPDNRRLKVQPSKKVFTGAEPIVLNAYLTNESGEKESDGIIELTLSGGNIDTRFYSMTNLGNGRYQLGINSLPRGIYDFTATAKKGNRTIDSQKGEFSVSNTNTEFVHTKRNDKLLQQISERTGGSYFTFSNLTGFADSLKEKGMLNREEKVTSTLFYPYQHSFWFILVIVLLTTEWITRKYLALT